MKKNDDNQTILMDVDMYHELLSLASIGASECGDHQTFARVERHVRKFNLPVKWRLLHDLQAAIKIAKENRAKTIQLINAAPKELFRKTRFDGQARYQRVKFVGRDLRHKQHVRVALPARVDRFESEPLVVSEHITTLVTSVPECWMEITHGPQKGMFMLMPPLNPTLADDFAAADLELGLATPHS